MAMSAAFILQHQAYSAALVKEICFLGMEFSFML